MMKPVSSHPWLMRRPYGEDRYFKTVGAARAAVITDLKNLQAVLGPLDSAAKLATGQAIDAANAIDSRGGSIDIMVDPYTRMRYRVTIMKREIE